MSGGFENLMEAWKKSSEINKELRENTGIYFEHTNPRIRLEDGSVIWGYECWWKPLGAKVPDSELEQVLKDGEQAIDSFCQVLKTLSKQVAEVVQQ